MKKTLGGDRLGAGKKMQVELHNYERSTHDMGYIWRSTMSAGTLVPFMSQVGLPGDSFDINLDCDIKTHPTIGPLFGSFKVQLDIFQCPIRLYQGLLHNNKLGIGLKMNTVKLPTVELKALELTSPIPSDLDNSQVNPSCILSYLGIRGIGINADIGGGAAKRSFNSIPWLAYWDIYKNYYSNKQEEIGAVIHTPAESLITVVTGIEINSSPLSEFPTVSGIDLLEGYTIVISKTSGVPQPLNQVMINTSYGAISANEIGELLSETLTEYTILYDFSKYGKRQALNWYYIDERTLPAGAIQVQTFPLDEIDKMREYILSKTSQTTPVKINDSAGQPDEALYPWKYILAGQGEEGQIQPTMYSQEGLGLKTYQSDLFNNWLQTDWIDGVGGISEITAIDTSGDSFTLDTLNLSKKVYDMLNRIAVSGGSYDDWLDAVYSHEKYTRAESPIYHGGLIKELIFQEVVSNSETGTENQGVQPLGTLAGKGILAKKHKGGNITIKVDEPSYIMGIISLTPRLDYSQGNTWDIHLQTMDDLHKPGLDEIGFQELITEQMAWWDTNWDGALWLTKSAGKQPAWINYMTNTNKVFGNFAIESNEMFMTLNRKYKPVFEDDITKIDDLTTYIDPAKYNSVFAQTSLDSQNYWAQIAVDITARRKISAKLMPNL